MKDLNDKCNFLVKYIRIMELTTHKDRIFINLPQKFTVNRNNLWRDPTE